MLSVEDVGGDETAITEIAEVCPLLVVTDGAHGARVHYEGRMRMIPAPAVVAIDPTGAGDIFAAAFFAALGRRRRDPASGAIRHGHRHPIGDAPRAWPASPRARKSTPPARPPA